MIANKENAIANAEAFSVSSIMHSERIQKLEGEMSSKQSALIKQLCSRAVTLTTHLKTLWTAEAKESIIATKSINEYELLLESEKRHSVEAHFMRNESADNQTKGKPSAKVMYHRKPANNLLMASATDPNLLRFSYTLYAALKEKQGVCSALVSHAFERMSREREELQAHSIEKLMGKKPDDEIEHSLSKLKKTLENINVQTKTERDTTIHIYFSLFRRIFSEYHRLLMVSRLRDIQMTTMLYNIDVTSLSVAKSEVTFSWRSSQTNNKIAPGNTLRLASRSNPKDFYYNQRHMQKIRLSSRAGGHISQKSPTSFKDKSASNTNTKLKSVSTKPEKRKIKDLYSCHTMGNASMHASTTGSNSDAEDLENDNNYTITTKNEQRVKVIPTVENTPPESAPKEIIGAEDKSSLPKKIEDVQTSLLSSTNKESNSQNGKPAICLLSKRKKEEILERNLLHFSEEKIDAGNLTYLVKCLSEDSFSSVRPWDNE